MKISSWNVRGFNCPLKHSEVKDFLKDNSMDVLTLLETRVKEYNVASIVNQHFGNWVVITNYSHHYNGRIWVFLNPVFVSITHTSKDAQFIHLHLHHFVSNLDFHLSLVYGSNNASERESPWQGLSRSFTTDPWLVLGDFNIVRDPAEKLSSTPPPLQEMLAFNNCLSTCHLDDLVSMGCDLTWTNKQEPNTRVWSKLDRALVNPAWLAAFPNSFAYFPEPGISDHSPTLVHVLDTYKVRKRFSFLDCWTDHSDFIGTVSDAWNTKVNGSPMYCFFQKLKSVKRALISFHKQHFTNLSHHAKTTKEELL
ncbi:uncharacterized protein LOC141651871 [Silene latifolia]|uniref:uncharacterized protein LOC141651871 n=1 Tax=Silene latifolia TaxID=37657 RepID=UPI003D77515C